MFCIHCGKEFDGNKMERYCEDCRSMKKEEAKKKQSEYAKKRTKDLNLTSISLYRDDKDTLQKMAKKKGVKMADILKDIISSLKK